MTDEDDCKPRRADEELIRMAIGHLRPDIAERALAWLDQKLGTKH